MPDDPNQDTQLAAYVDRLLAGEPLPEVEDRDDLTSIVQHLHAIIEPGADPPSAFRNRLRQRLAMEWNLQYQRQARRWVWSMPRLAAVAAGVALVLVVVVLLGSVEGGGDGLQGTATGSVAGIALAIVGLVVVGALLIWWNRRS